MSHIAFDSDTFSPSVNTNGQCSDPAYYAAGNIRQLTPSKGRNAYFYTNDNPPNAVNISGMCWDQGGEVALNILKSLDG